MLALLFAFCCSIVSAQEIHVSSGSIKRFEHFPSQFVDPRTVDVWLPADYDGNKKYAVLYMQDGQMLFDSTKTWNHLEWGVDETLGRLIREKKIGPCIVVAIWNNGPKRAIEYLPQKAFDALSKSEKQLLFTGKDSRNQKPLLSGVPVSDNYLKFLVRELKPHIDKTFSTRPERAHTFVMGASMGGLISMYAICEYPKVFGGAACLSTHWIGVYRKENNPVPAALLNYLKQHLPAPKGHRLYFDHGTVKQDSLYGIYQKQADAILKARGYELNKNWLTRVFEGAEHSERAWRRRFDIPLLFLFKD